MGRDEEGCPPEVETVVHDGVIALVVIRLDVVLGPLLRRADRPDLPQQLDVPGCRESRGL